ncbi:hypothetical protein [Pantoea agglomerans]|uniref:hypothetical protein n=1 Tax=Enterobacter agglomerans TaxID=549 RepID=UPI001FD701D5|nr:hypothetical protein [Pantoea agglomerans]UOV17043.1 hypothetical protein LZ609_00805 [Pantoea agglomerans]
MRIFDDKTIIVIWTSYEGYSVNSSLLFNTTHDTFKRWGCYLITQHFHFVVTSIVFNDSSFWQKLRLNGNSQSLRTERPLLAHYGRSPPVSSFYVAILNILA